MDGDCGDVGMGCKYSACGMEMFWSKKVGCHRQTHISQRSWNLKYVT